jgi:hypothetical protein
MPFKLNKQENERLFEQLKSGILPDRCGWNMNTAEGDVPVHIAARDDLPAADFLKWSLPDDRGLADFPGRMSRLNTALSPSVSATGRSEVSATGRSATGLNVRSNTPPSKHEPVPPNLDRRTMSGGHCLHVDETARISGNLPTGFSCRRILQETAATPRITVSTPPPTAHDYSALTPMSAVPLPSLCVIPIGVAAENGLPVLPDNFPYDFNLFGDDLSRMTTRRGT